MLEFRRRTDPKARIDGVDPLLAPLLAARGITTREEAEAFFHPTADMLQDPLTMPGMAEAVRLVREAVMGGKRILVYGDYDCDGVCSTALMLETLREMGAEPGFYIPSREEGYGLNTSAVRELAREWQMLLTVDCGITSVEEVRLARALGMTVLVTDHHQLAEELPPADGILNPELGYSTPLCGAGVALKLTQALLGMEAAAKRIDLAALATVADIVPLRGENRVIVAEGLRAIGRTERPGLRALMDLAGVKPPVRAEDVGFRLGPRINAGGRIDTASVCVDLLTTGDRAEGERIASQLERLNAERSAIQADISAAAERVVREEADFRTDRVLVVMGKGWPSGIIGLAAGRICEQYHWPTVVLTEREDGTAVGSCRSIPGVHIHRELTRCKDLFIRFGGHAQAAGLTMEARLVPELRRRLSLCIAEDCDPAAFVPVAEYDGEMTLGQATLDLIDRLALFEPTGCGNEAPVFLARRAEVQEMRPVGRDRAHLKLTLSQGGESRGGIAWRMGGLARQPLTLVDVLFAPQRNDFNGVVGPQLMVKAVAPAEGTASLPEDGALFEALLQEIVCLAEKDNLLAEQPEAAPLTEAAVSRLLEGRLGVLLIAHTRERAERFAAPGGLDVLTGEVTDGRAFNTLLCGPRVDALRDVWQHIVLLEGDVVPGEAAFLRAQCPRAELHALKHPLTALRGRLRETAADLDGLRRLYARVRRGGEMSRHTLAADAGLTPDQVLIGLHALREVGLADFTPQPWRVCLLPPEKRSPEDSPVIRLLRGL